MTKRKTFEQKYNKLLNAPEMQQVAPDNHYETSVYVSPDGSSHPIEHFRPFPRVEGVDHLDDDIFNLFAWWLTENDQNDMEHEFDTSQYEDEDDYDENEAVCDALDRNHVWVADNFKRTWREGISYHDWSEATRRLLGLLNDGEIAAYNSKVKG
jgi:hypothetical protein